MSFEKMKEQLLLEFRNNEAVWKDCKNNLHSKTYDITTELKILYPGRKTEEKESFHYDYLVTFNGRWVTHKQIIIDLYNKVN